MAQGKQLVGPNPTPSTKMAPTERLAEVAEILALGILRLRLETLASKEAKRGDSSLDFTPAESGREPRREAVGKRR
jgi:hypothetical protein